MIVMTLSVILAIHPFSFISVAICMNKASLAIALVLIPKSLVDRSISVEINTETFARFVF
jgi:hypothetical protein